jgi:hypothetical protein
MRVGWKKPGLAVVNKSGFLLFSFAMYEETRLTTSGCGNESRF